jgi:replicative DNA helicase
MSSDIDKTQLYILKGMLRISDYLAKFNDKVDPNSFIPELQPVIKLVKLFYAKYSKAPTAEQLIDVILPRNLKDEEKVADAEGFILEALSLKFEKQDYNWLVDETVGFIKKNAMEDALMSAYDLIKNGNMDDAVKVVQQANNLVVDEDLGLDYWEDLAERTERMKTGQEVIPTGIEALDNVLNGGWHKKTLNIFGAGTNVGKTLILSDTSMKLMMQGLNGLYITLEIYQDLLANRVDANLTETEMSDIPENADDVMKTLLYLKDQAEKDGDPFGRFIIKESAPNCLNSNGILSLVRELELKRTFKPDFIVIDYIGLLAPNASSSADNTYSKLKTVAEELRAVASILEVPIFSAVQVNRDAYGSNRPGLENTSDSMGIPMSADIMIMVSRDEDADSSNEDGNNASVMNWHLAKSRVSKNNVSFEMSVQYEYQRIVSSDIEGVSVDNSVSVNAQRAKQHVQLQKDKAEHSIDNSENKTEKGSDDHAKEPHGINI